MKFKAKAEPMMEEMMYVEEDYETALESKDGFWKEELIDVDDVSILNVIVRVIVSLVIPVIIIGLMGDTLMPLEYTVLSVFVYLGITWSSIIKRMTGEPGGTGGYYYCNPIIDLVLRFCWPIIALVIVCIGCPLLIGSILNSETLTDVLMVISLTFALVFPFVRDIKIIVRTFRG